MTIERNDMKDPKDFKKDDFDNAIIEYLVSEFKKSNGIDLTGDKMSMQRLKDAAESAKIELSSATTAQINLPFITSDANGPKHINLSLSRAKFNELTQDLVQATKDPMQKAIDDAGLKIGDIDRSDEGESVFSERRSIILKSLKVKRIFDAGNQTLIYVAHSREIQDGSAKMSISTVPLYQAGAVSN